MANCLFCAVSVPPTYFIEDDGKVIKIKSGINGSFNGKPFQLEDRGDLAVHDEIKTFFVLRNILNISHKILSGLLGLCEGDSHPEHWVNVCEKCGDMVCQFYLETKNNLRSEMERQNIVEELRRKIYVSMRNHDVLAGGPIWKMIRSEALKDKTVGPTKSEWGNFGKNTGSSYTRPPTSGPPRLSSPILIDLVDDDDEEENDRSVNFTIIPESATGSLNNTIFTSKEQVRNATESSTIIIPAPEVTQAPTAIICVEKEQDIGNKSDRERLSTEMEMVEIFSTENIITESYMPSNVDDGAFAAAASHLPHNDNGNTSKIQTELLDLNENQRFQNVSNRPIEGIRMEVNVEANKSEVSQAPSPLVPPPFPLVVPQPLSPTSILSGVNSNLNLLALVTIEAARLNQQPNPTEIPATFSQVKVQSSILTGNSTPTLASSGVDEDEYYLVEQSATNGTSPETTQIPPKKKIYLIKRKSNQLRPPAPAEEASILEEETPMIDGTPLEALENVSKCPAILRKTTHPTPTHVAPSNSPTAQDVSAEKRKSKPPSDIPKPKYSNAALKHTLSESATLLLLPRQLLASSSQLISQPRNIGVAPAPASSTPPPKYSSPQTALPSLTNKKRPTPLNHPRPTPVLPYLLEKIGSTTFFKCQMCPAMKTSLVFIETHLKLHHGSDSNYTFCEICNYPLLTEKLDQHRSLRHPPTPSEIHNSSLPPSRNFPGKDKAASHYKCSHCPATLSNSGTMKAHQRLHLENSSAIVCPEPRCGWFVLRERMVHHQGRHHPENHAKCVPCHQQFFNDNDQHEHLKLHELNQVCDVCGSLSTDLTQHYALHHAMDKEDGNGKSLSGAEGNEKGSPPPSSPITRTENLELIEKQKIPETKWKCGKCTAEFSTEAAHQEHENKNHVAVNVFDEDDDDGREECDVCGWRAKILVKHKAKYHPTREFKGKETPVDASSSSSKKREVKLEKGPAEDTLKVGKKCNKKIKLSENEDAKSGNKKKSVVGLTKPRSKPYYACTKNGTRFYKCYECGKVVKKLDLIRKHVQRHEENGEKCPS